MSKKDKVRSQETWNWLKTALLKKETEGMLMDAQDEALRTNIVRRKRVMWLQNVESLHTSSTAYGGII